jgi:hypothetical protein
MKYTATFIEATVTDAKLHVIFGKNFHLNKGQNKNQQQLNPTSTIMQLVLHQS